jgi:hypothetical protein
VDRLRKSSGAPPVGSTERISLNPEKSRSGCATGLDAENHLLTSVLALPVWRSAVRDASLLTGVSASTSGLVLAEKRPLHKDGTQYATNTIESEIIPKYHVHCCGQVSRMAWTLPTTSGQIVQAQII